MRRFTGSPSSWRRALAAAPLIIYAACTTSAPEGRHYSPYPGQDIPQTVYWGDTHVHTRLSTDAYTFGNTTVSPELAYRFARGETITTSSGQPAQLRRPLDFILLSDHAEYLGVFPALAGKDPAILDTALGQRWAPLFDQGKMTHAFAQVMQVKRAELDLPQDAAFLQSAWQQVTAAADRANQPGVFTAFIGYEWTSMPTGNNLHRNMVFRDGADKANQVLPFSALDSHDPRDLWNYLQDYESKTGGRVLAIPHNGNGSNGTMFPERTLSGEPLTQAYARSRARWEPIYEATQIKGDGETHPQFSPDDQFADFETWDSGNFGGIAKHPSMLKHEYARGGLELGLEYDKTLGSNPFKFGMIGSSDAHTSLAAVEENNFFGKFGMDEPRPNRAAGKLETMKTSTYVASGYAGVWATDNTREALFDAMQRREVYATTGPRMVLRFFGGWDFDPQDDKHPDFAALGYRKGVPMGGDLSAASGEQRPRFLVFAGKDPQGANLDRIQIVKGWLDGDGSSLERVYDVALADGRQVDPRTGKAPAIGSTVNINTASYSNTIGAPQLGTVWEDPDFDPGQRAFYYVRVLEIPTPRWTTYDAVFYGTELPSNVPAIIQERAYSSPIWYTP
jgi:Protein of unknown function (DUF3604)